jgi:hypothetical protein
MPEDTKANIVDGTMIGTGSAPAQASGRPDALISAHFVAPAGVALTFADGLTARTTFAALDVNPADLLLPTTKASASGEALEVTCSDGEVIRIDALALRAAVDPAFAAEFERKMTAARGPLSELLKAAPKHEPPQEWWDENEDENS